MAACERGALEKAQQVARRGRVERCSFVKLDAQRALDAHQHLDPCQAVECEVRLERIVQTKVPLAERRMQFVRQRDEQRQQLLRGR